MMDSSGSGLSSTTENAADSRMSCRKHKENITDGLAPWELISFLTPSDTRIWDERSEGWSVVLMIYAAVFAFLFFFLGIMAVVLIYKKDCIRLKTKTFFALYLTIAILGFTRFLHLVLDPYNSIGFISNQFAEWITISRILASFGFPSLVASFTLMFVTLLTLANTKLEKRNKWYQQWRYVIPILVVSYAISLSAEIIGISVPYPGLFSVVLCEIVFMVWGVAICVIYLFAGTRLLRRVQLHESRTFKRVSSVPGGEEGRSQQKQFVTRVIERHQKSMHKTTRKISIITFTTAVVGIIYSVISSANLVLLCLLLFYECLGLRGRTSSVAWLILASALRTTEVLLALIMLYSITDVSKAVNLMKRILACHCCRANTEPLACNGHSRALANFHFTASQANMFPDSQQTETNLNNVEDGLPVTHLENGSTANLLEEHEETDRTATTFAEVHAQRTPSYTLHAQESDSSIDAVNVSEILTSDKSTQTVQQSDKAVQTDRPTFKSRPKLHYPPKSSTTTDSKFARKYTV